ncbi:MAG: hypothetical protein IKP68_03745 [Clostridia bacterium]|nr:hypothetical protein [Clostridia bacterium]
MKYSIAGVKTVDFTDKDDNSIKGISIYLASPIPSDKGSGLEVDKFFFSSKRVSEVDSSLKVGSDVDVVFNKYGKIDNIYDLK